MYTYDKHKKLLSGEYTQLVIPPSILFFKLQTLKYIQNIYYIVCWIHCLSSKSKSPVLLLQTTDTHHLGFFFQLFYSTKYFGSFLPGFVACSCLQCVFDRVNTHLVVLLHTILSTLERNRDFKFRVQLHINTLIPLPRSKKAFFLYD